MEEYSLCCKSNCPTITYGQDKVIITDDFGNEINIEKNIAFRLALKILTSHYNSMHDSHGKILQDIDSMISVKPIDTGTVKLAIDFSSGVIMHPDEAYKLAIIIIAQNYRARTGEYPLDPNSTYPVNSIDELSQQEVVGV